MSKDKIAPSGIASGPMKIDGGLLVAIDGIDGAGKTTQAESLAAAIEGFGYHVIRTKEPTNGKWGRKLRESASSGRLSREKELELFMKDRREDVETCIRPALDRGDVVIVDRYYFSTAAYQGALGLDPAALIAKNELFAPKPGLLVLLDLPPAVGLQRIRSRGDVANLFEREENLEKAAAIFRAMDFAYLLRLDGTQPAQMVTNRILDTLLCGPLAPNAPLWRAGERPTRNSEAWDATAKV